MNKEWVKQFEGKTIKEIKVTGYEVTITFEETNDVLYVEGEHEYVGVEIGMHSNSKLN
ncbi:hypothetical protein Kirov_236 [Bacillus phage Kirov]|uniref:Uncharacterized protein n=1 Tax=Bacillus phage Kirov TaxID=2783539 RepID=A0A7U3RXS9_9CAUD|nr:hypothetical protein PQE67_gp068 [Bacillus phage Kirov]QOV08435.1 hypothetical protein Kirov_236 [Bacillus phage Kirov]